MFIFDIVLGLAIVAFICLTITFVFPYTYEFRCSAYEKLNRCREKIHDWWTREREIPVQQAVPNPTVVCPTMKMLGMTKEEFAKVIAPMTVEEYAKMENNAAIFAWTFVSVLIASFLILFLISPGAGILIVLGFIVFKYPVAVAIGCFICGVGFK